MILTIIYCIRVKYSEAKVNEKFIQSSNIPNKNEGILVTGLPNKLIIQTNH